MRLALTALAAWTALFPLRAAATDAPELPPVAASLGLKSELGSWVYERRHPTEDRLVRHALDDQEQKKVAEFLKILPQSSPDPLLALVAKKALAKEGLKPEDTVWFKAAPGGPVLTPLGKGAVIGIVLGDLYGDKLAASEPAPKPKTAAAPKPAVDAAKAGAALAKGGKAAAAGAAAFDGSAPNAPDGPPPVFLGYGTWPAAESRARMEQGLYSMYGWGSDRALDKAFGEANSGGKIAARFAKGFVLDIPVGLVGSFWQHETGHFETAWQAGAHPFWDHGGTSNFAGILGQTSVPSAEWDTWSPYQKMRFNAGGIFSSQSGAAAMRREALAGDTLHWSVLPLWTFEKMDATVYPFITPAPGQESSSQKAFDTVDWRDNYAARSKKSPSAVHAEMVAGAVWNMVDPMAAWAAYSYFVSYLVKGKENLETPMPRIGDIQVLPGTNFWLSEVGPLYSLSLLARDPKSKTVVDFGVTAGEDSQGGFSVKASNIPISAWTKGRVSGGIWAQRRAAEPGPKVVGGSVGIGLDQQAFGGTWLSLDGGVKTSGSELGRDFAAGPFFSAGVKGNTP